MLEEYQKFTITLYFNHNTKAFCNWAKIYWLLKCAHPIELLEIQIDAIKHDALSLTQWLKMNAPLHQPKLGLYVPVTVRPIMEIDFLSTDDLKNRFCQFQDGSLAFCVMDDKNLDYKKVDATSVFEDFTQEIDYPKIYEEIHILHNELHLNA